MSPENIDCLGAAGIDCCVLANNHVLDWGSPGLLDTLSILNSHRIKTAGAGRNLDEAVAPAVLAIGAHARILVYSFASVTSGTPSAWAATRDQPGVNLLDDLSEAAASRLADNMTRVKRPGDVIVLSIHWGPNWGYEIPAEQRRFAYALIKQAGVSVVHGHSSHHPKAVEVHDNRLILYGCGDFLNDYEGIKGYEEFRNDLALMYFVDIDPAQGTLVAAEIVPLQIRKFQLLRALRQDTEWVQQMLDRESRQFATRVERAADERLRLSWESRAQVLR